MLAVCPLRATATQSLRISVQRLVKIPTRLGFDPAEQTRRRKLRSSKTNANSRACARSAPSSGCKRVLLRSSNLRIDPPSRQIVRQLWYVISTRADTRALDCTALRSAQHHSRKSFIFGSKFFGRARCRRISTLDLVARVPFTSTRRRLSCLSSTTILDPDAICGGRAVNQHHRSEA